MTKPTPDQQAAFDAKLAGYKFDTSEYVTLSDKTRGVAMSDIVERLKARGFRLAARDLNGDGAKLAVDAADEITRLQARVAELEGIVEYATDYLEVLVDDGNLKSARITLNWINKALKGGA